MACTRREKTGQCSHHQCAFKDSTLEGYECVDLVEGYCEVGADCVRECPHSWETSDVDRSQLADEAWRRYCEAEC